MTAPCGLDCFNCALYLANDNEKIRKVVTEKIQMPFQDTACSGCRSQGGIISALKRTEPCQVFKCIPQKGIEVLF
jgi:hypothetical protein